MLDHLYFNANTYLIHSDQDEFLLDINLLLLFWTLKSRY